MQQRRRLGLGVLTLLAVAVAAWVVSPAVAFENVERLTSTPLVFIAVVFVVAVIRPFLAWPTLLLPIGIGYVYGLAGLPLAVAALVVTGLPPYWFGVSATAKSGQVTTAGEQFLSETGGVRGVAAARLFPVPSDVISVAAGAVGVRFRPFVVGTLFGELPWAILGILAGGSVDRLTTGALSRAVDPWLVAGMTALAILLLAGPCYRLVSARNTTELPTSE